MRLRAGPWTWIAVLGLAACARAVQLDQSCLARIKEGGRVGRIEPPSIEARLDSLEIDNAKRASAIERMFRDAGCEPLRIERFAGSELPNVICTLPGPSGSRTLVVGAHYDRAEKGQGAADNWTGAALLPSLYQSLRVVDRRHTLEFVAFGAEESGLLGSKAYVAALDERARGERVAMVNMDTLGLGPARIDDRVSDPYLVCFLFAAERIVGARTEFASVTRVGTSDYEPFREAGIPALSIHSLSTKTLPILHTEQDTLERIDRVAYYQSYQVIATFLALVDRYLPEDFGPRPDPAATR